MSPDITVGTLLDLANKITVVGLLFIIIYGGTKQWWVWGWQYRQVQRDANEWKQMTLRLLAATQRTISAGERQTAIAEKVVQTVQDLPETGNKAEIVERTLRDMQRHMEKTGFD